MNNDEARAVRNLINNAERLLKRVPSHWPTAHLKRSIQDLREIMVEQRRIRSKEFEAKTDDGYMVTVKAATQWHANQVAEKH